MKKILFGLLCISSLCFCDEVFNVLDMKNEKVLPHLFRTMHDTFKQKENEDPSKFGLDKLNASGSSQFSYLAFDAIQEHLPSDHLHIIDLRQESHGFANGTAIAFENYLNNANSGKTSEEIDKIESIALENLLNKDEKFYPVIRKPGINDFIWKHPYLIAVKEISTEKKFINNLNQKYTRFYVTDSHKPTDEEANRFVQLIINKDPEEWFHIHCRDGHSRTTIFLCMYDSIINSKAVTFDAILQRQFLLGGRNFEKKNSSHKADLDLQFLEQFYNYCKNNKDGFKSPFVSLKDG